MDIIIIEDESFAARRLENMIAEIDGSICVKAKLESVSESVNWLNKNQLPDLIFLDIHLDDDLSFSIFKSIKVNCPIVFTTATDEMATRGFALLGIDYLLKPIVLTELKAIIEKYSDISNWNGQTINPEIFTDIINRNIKK